MRVRELGLAVVWLAVGTMGFGQAATPGTAPGQKRSCAIEHVVSNEADKAIARQDFVQAEALYRGMMDGLGSSAAVVGVVRSELGQRKLAEALALAVQETTAHPADALLQMALGEVRLRRGEVVEAALALTQSQRLDLCIARGHYDVARYLRLKGMLATAREQLDLARSLSPEDGVIRRAWMAEHATPPTAAERIERLTERMKNENLTDEQREGLAAALKAARVREKGDCQMVSPVTTAKLEMLSISNGPSYPVYAMGLKVLLNGHEKKFELDTGASGLLISRASAKSAGLVPELEIKAGGIGDSGPASAFVTHVDDLRIGGMEFKNCMVRVLEKSSVLEIDGLIGTDVFGNYLVTLDTPGRQLRLDPLPKRPDEVAETAASLDTEGADDVSAVAVAKGPRDRYIAPEMKGWTTIFRVGHELIVATNIGKAPTKLFLLDTGSARTMISPEAAREVTRVSGNEMQRVKGISGEVKKVYEADNVQVSFGGVAQMTRGMTSIDTSAISRGTGVEISGVIGFPMLRELVVTIDYRDDVIHVVYDPKHGYHQR